MEDSRMDLILRKLNGEDVELVPPISRIEKIYFKLLGYDIELDPPQSRSEVLLTEYVNNGGGGGGGSSLPTVTFTFTGMDSGGMPIFECDKTYNEAYQIHMSGDSCAKLIGLSQDPKYTTLVLLMGESLRYAFYAYHSNNVLEFNDLYYLPDGTTGFEESIYERVPDDDDTPTE